MTHRTSLVLVAALGGTLLGSIAAHAGPGRGVQTTKTVGDLRITAKWSETASGRFHATGDVDLGPVTLGAADVSIDTRRGNETVTATGDLDLELFEDCWLNAPGASMGYATGADIVRNVGDDAPVQADRSYLYVDVDNSTALNCFGFEVDIAGGQAAKLYIDPSDPSIYVRATGLTEALAGVSAATEALYGNMGLEIDDAYIGLSAGGWVPWTASHRIDGDRPEIDAHLLIGGSFSFKAGTVRVAVDDGSVAVRLDGDEVDVIGASGDLLIPGFATEYGDLDLPVAAGAAVLDGGLLSFEVTVGGNPYAGLALPSLVRDLVSQGAATDGGRLAGIIDTRNLAGSRVTIGRRGGFGPFDVDAAVTLTAGQILVQGSADYTLLGHDLAHGEVHGFFFWPSSSSVTVTGDVPLGLANATMHARVSLGSNGKLSGSADARVWGVKTDGDMRFSGGPAYAFRSLDLTHKVNFWIGDVQLKVKVRPDSVSARAICGAFGYTFDVGVNSNGCFTGAGVHLCF